MTRQLKDLNIQEVSLFPQGADQDAHVTLAKSAQSAPLDDSEALPDTIAKAASARLEAMVDEAMRRDLALTRPRAYASVMKTADGRDAYAERVMGVAKREVPTPVTKAVVEAASEGVRALAKEARQRHPELTEQQALAEALRSDVGREYYALRRRWFDETGSPAGALS